MSAELAQHIATIAPDGLQINLWPSEKGYQANVKETASRGWTITSDADPVEALLKALRMRVTRHPGRPVADGKAPKPQQIDLEEAIAATMSHSSAVDCAHGVPMSLPCGACEADAALQTDPLAEFGL